MGIYLLINHPKTILERHNISVDLISVFYCIRCKTSSSIAPLIGTGVKFVEVVVTYHSGHDGAP